MTDTDKPSIKKYENRLIGFFDVLGFSKLLEQRPVEELHRDYATLIDEARSTIFEQNALAGSPEPHVSNFEKSQFLFDSIVVVSYPTDDVKNICKFVLSCILLMEKTFARGFFLRGCISLGDFLDDPERNISLSPQFPKLISAEKEQQWCGCYVDDKTEAIVLDGIFRLNYLRSNEFSPTRSMPLIQYDVPLKNGSNRGQWCLNWVAMMDLPLLKSKLQLLISPKRENTEQFMQHVFSLQDDSQILPPDAKPAVRLSFMKTRGGMRLKFADEHGCGVDPLQSWNLQIVLAGGQ